MTSTSMVPAFERVQPSPAGCPTPDRRIRKIGHVPYDEMSRVVAGDGGSSRAHIVRLRRGGAPDAQVNLLAVRDPCRRRIRPAQTSIHNHFRYASPRCGPGWIRRWISSENCKASDSMPHCLVHSKLNQQKQPSQSTRNEPGGRMMGTSIAQEPRV